MDMDDPPRSQHAPPILFQSDDQEPGVDHLTHGHEQDLPHRHRQSSLHPLSFASPEEALERHQRYSHQADIRSENDEDDLFGYHESSDIRRELEQQRRQDALEQEEEKEEPVHVHSQACRDSCPVQDVYTETTFTRFSKGARTNLYGLVVLKELGEYQSGPSPQQDPPAAVPDTGVEDTERSSIFTTNGDVAYSHLPARYVLVAAGGVIKYFLGLQESVDFTLGGSTAGTGSGVTEPGVTTDNGAASTPTASTPTATAQVLNQEIISFDAFVRKDKRGCQLIVVASVATGDDPAQFELRIYGANSFGASIKDLLIRLPDTTDVQSIPLSWAPTKIIHAPLENDPFDMGVLVAGSDSCVHIFVQDQTPTPSGDRLFVEQSIGVHFSVLASFPYCEYCVLSLVIKDYPTYRIVAAGTQSGTLNIAVIPRDPKTFQMNRANAKSYTIVLFAPITTLNVFTSRVQPDRRKRHGDDYRSRAATDDQGHDDAVDEAQDEEVGIHLLVTCAIEQAWIYCDINKYGLSRRSDLAECTYHDSMLAAHVMDADWDGRNELMIGTYGRQLMVFKELLPGQGPYIGYIPIEFHHAHGQHLASTTTLATTTNTAANANATLGVSSARDSSAVVPPAPQWGMTWNRRFATPVYGISSADLNDDGLEELVVTTLNGVSFFLPDPWTAKRRLAQAVKRMQEIEEMRATLDRLKTSNEELVETQRVKDLERRRQQQQREQEKEEEKEKQEAMRRESEAREQAEYDQKRDDGETAPMSAAEPEVEEHEASKRIATDVNEEQGDDKFDEVREDAQDGDSDEKSEQDVLVDPPTAGNVQDRVDSQNSREREHDEAAVARKDQIEEEGKASKEEGAGT
ncbi:hypothetical protein BGZ98_005347 [Dissophora globulifera]|nr:hypothetical protein BGZ98_005347 [Dissophora globulifera]